ncbi:MAG: TetR/AcrR family transcriptional regulator [Paraglaciecola sp.]|nr:TetR/AcrR family transcriptional regulator [Paraglaciecola sp.]
MTNKKIVKGAALLQGNKTSAIKRAALIEVAKKGYARLTMEAVAKRAKVGKAALYRRWSGKEDMLIDLLHTIGLEIVSVEDQGSLEADLTAYVKQTIQLLKRPLAKKILPDLYAEMTRDTLFAEKIRQVMQRPKRAKASEIMERAIVRKEINTPIDKEIMLDALAGIIYWRFIITQEPLNEDYSASLVAILVAVFTATK